MFQRAVDVATLAVRGQARMNTQVFVEMTKLCGLGMVSMKAMGGR